MNVELFIDITDVAVEGALADAQVIDNFLVAEALCELLRTSFSRGVSFGSSTGGSGVC